MSIVAPITVAWQNVVDSAKGQAKEVETFSSLEDSIIRAKNVIAAANNLQNSEFTGSDPQAHVTVHPGRYEYGDSITEDDQLEDVFITILPGATVTDANETFLPDKTSNVADLNSFAETAYFSQSQDTFVYENPVRFREEVIFQENTFPVKKVEGGEKIDVSSSFGDVTVTHGDTGGASDNNESTSFLNEIIFDDAGHVQSTGFGTLEKGVSVEDDAQNVLDLAKTLNFGKNITAVEEQSQSVTVKLEGASSFEISDVQNLFPFGKRISKISGTTGTEAILSSAVDGTNKNELFKNSTDTEKGIITSEVSGQINPQVEETKSHVANSFSPGFIGVLKLIVNGSDLITLNLDQTQSSISETTSNGSKLSVSSAFPLDFQTGENFEQRTQRSGTWTVKKSDMSYGLNTIKIVHVDGSQTVIGQSQEIRYYLENTSPTIEIGDPDFKNLSLENTKLLSGIEYYKKGTVDFSISVANAYKTVYGEGNAIDYPENKNVNIQPHSVPPLQENEDANTLLDIVKSLTINSNFLVGEPIETKFRIEDPIEGTKTSSKESSYDLLINSLSKENTGLTHYFEDENYRADPSSDFDSNLHSGSYDSSQSIKDGTEYENQLQVGGGKITYPNVDYSQIDNAPTNPDYSGATGQRTYYGIFRNTTSSSNFVINVRGEGQIVSKQNLGFNTDEVSIEIKIPTQTGWMDVNKFFCLGNHEDGDGAYMESNAQNPNKTIGPDSEIGLTVGTKSTAKGYNKLYYRITSAENWTGEIKKMSISWGI